MNQRFSGFLQVLMQKKEGNVKVALSMEFSRPEYWSGQPFPSPGDLPNSGIKLGSPALRVDSLPAEPPEKPKNTRLGSLPLLQGIFPTQESNWGLLYCRRILCQLSYQGSPEKRREEERNIHLRWPAVSLAAIFFFSESRERKNYRGQKYRKPTSD